MAFRQFSSEGGFRISGSVVIRVGMLADGGLHPSPGTNGREGFRNDLLAELEATTP